MKRFYLIFALFLAFPLIAGAQFDRDLFFGIANDPDVTRLQEFLRDQGVYDGPVTGNFFALTQEGVKNFQAREGIKPVAGYFGPLTRARANELLRVSAPASAAPVSGLTDAQVESILDLLRAFNAEESVIANVRAALVVAPPPLPKPEEKPEGAKETTDTLPPAFTVVPRVLNAGFVSDSPFGVRYPYRVTFTWEHDESNPSEEVVSCTPPLGNKTSQGKNAEYFPEGGTDYSCSVTVKDQAGNEARAGFAFSSPPWASVATKSTNQFPEVEVTPFKIGEFTVYNGTGNDVLFANFETLLIDETDSTPNRGRKVFFKLRDGSKVTDTEISETEFTFITSHPKVGDPHKYIVKFPYDVKLKFGDEKTVSLWVEQFKYVKSGTLQIKTTDIVTTNSDLKVQGGFDFILTREPPL